MKDVGSVLTFESFKALQGELMAGLPSSQAPVYSMPLRTSANVSKALLPHKTNRTSLSDVFRSPDGRESDALKVKLVSTQKRV